MRQESGKGGRRKSLAGGAAVRPVNPQVRTFPGGPANFRLCATFCREQLQQGPLNRAWF